MNDINAKTSWNYRILAHKIGNYIEMQIHEVYYDNEQQKPVGYTENAHISGDSVMEIKTTIELMKGALDLPILWHGDEFPNEYKKD